MKPTKFIILSVYASSAQLQTLAETTDVVLQDLDGDEVITYTFSALTPLAEMKCIIRDLAPEIIGHVRNGAKLLVIAPLEFRRGLAIPGSPLKDGLARLDLTLKGGGIVWMAETGMSLSPRDRRGPYHRIMPFPKNVNARNFRRLLGSALGFLLTHETPFPADQAFGGARFLRGPNGPAGPEGFDGQGGPQGPDGSGGPGGLDGPGESGGPGEPGGPHEFGGPGRSEGSEGSEGCAASAGHFKIGRSPTGVAQTGRFPSRRHLGSTWKTGIPSRTSSLPRSEPVSNASFRDRLAEEMMSDSDILVREMKAPKATAFGDNPLVRPPSGKSSPGNRGQSNFSQNDGHQETMESPGAEKPAN